VLGTLRLGWKFEGGRAPAESGPSLVLAPSPHFSVRRRLPDKTWRYVYHVGGQNQEEFWPRRLVFAKSRFRLPDGTSLACPQRWAERILPGRPDLLIASSPRVDRVAAIACLSGRRCRKRVRASRGTLLCLRHTDRQAIGATREK
jgi:hypothetical protein